MVHYILWQDVCSEMYVCSMCIRKQTQTTSVTLTIVWSLWLYYQCSICYLGCELTTYIVNIHASSTQFGPRDKTHNIRSYIIDMGANNNITISYLTSCLAIIILYLYMYRHSLQLWAFKNGCRNVLLTALTMVDTVSPVRPARYWGQRELYMHTEVYSYHL